MNALRPAIELPRQPCRTGAVEQAPIRGGPEFAEVPPHQGHQDRRNRDGPDRASGRCLSPRCSCGFAVAGPRGASARARAGQHHHPALWAGRAYGTSWQFDQLGDQTAQTQHSLTGGQDTVFTYSYDGNGASQPNTLTSAGTAGPSGLGTATTPAGAAHYAYDANGNLLAQCDPGQTAVFLFGGAQQLTGSGGSGIAGWF